MASAQLALLGDRGVVRIGGEDRITFLQGLVSNDVRRATGDRVLYAALLSPQGKFLHDLFIAAWDDALLVDCEAARADDLCTRLRRYRLRAKVEIDRMDDRFAVAVAFGPDAIASLPFPQAVEGAAIGFAGGLAYVDPRLAEGGLRMFTSQAHALALPELVRLPMGDRDGYDCWRIPLGLPDGSRDIPVEKAILLECGFDELHGIDWEKGCYVGQEVTARSRYRGLVKKRLIPVRVRGDLPPTGAPILFAGREAGEIRSGVRGWALALLRLDALQGSTAASDAFISGDALLTPQPPPWLKLASD